jgi:restriction endonuclease Mrr
VPIPTAGTILQEFLREISDGKRHDPNAVRKKLVGLFGITPDEAAQRLPSGGESVLSNRFRNAKFRLCSQRLALFEDSGDFVVITDTGRQRLSSMSQSISYTTTTTRQQQVVDL